MRPIQNVIGLKFGRLTVIEECERRLYERRSVRVVRATCDCGNQKEFVLTGLRSGETRSCGCLRKETTRENAKKSHMNPWKKHGLTDTAEHYIWRAIKQRCTNPSNHAYHRYGARGITMCDAWLNSFETFLKDVGHRPNQELTIERIDNNAGYHPGNCIWATCAAQTKNRRCSISFLVDGRQITLKEYAKTSGMPYTTVYRWHKYKGMTIEEIIRRSASAKRPL